MCPSITFQTISYRNQKMETKSKEKAGKYVEYWSPCRSFENEEEHFRTECISVEEKCMMLKDCCFAGKDSQVFEKWTLCGLIPWSIWKLSRKADFKHIFTTKINTAKKAGRVLREHVTGDLRHLKGWRGLPGGSYN